MDSDRLAPRAIFDNLSLDEIRRYVADGEQETLHTEFKTLKISGKLTKDDRKNLAKAISGFANADGGVVVWGIRAEKDSDDVDCACELCPLENAGLAHSTLESLTGHASSPMVDGVEHRVLITEGDSGFLATYVPPSDAGPHMAKLGEDRYYKRSGDSFRKMEHFDIEDMFGRRAKPRLACQLEPLQFGSYMNPDLGPPRAQILCRGSVVVKLRNDGRGVAKFPYVALTVEEPFEFSSYGIDGNSNTGLPEIRGPATTSRQKVFAGGSDDVLHIDSSLGITIIEVTGISAKPASNPILRVHYRVVAEGIRPLSGTAELGGNALADLTKGVPYPAEFYNADS